MTEEIVIQITGSRGWTSYKIIYEALSVYHGRGYKVTVRHGDCYDGADMLADRAAKELGFEIDAMPADWDTYKRAAGYKRNTAMVEKEPKPNVCLAFGMKCLIKNCKENNGKPHVSHGTRHCASEAVRMGIEVIRFKAGF